MEYEVILQPYGRDRNRKIPGNDGSDEDDGKADRWYGYTYRQGKGDKSLRNKPDYPDIPFQATATKNLVEGALLSTGR